VQEFLSRVRWDADAVRDDLRAYVAEHLGDPGGVLVLDETGFVKKGREVGGGTSAVQRDGRALIDRALYLPENWASDGARRAEAGVPAAVGFGTKPKLGLVISIGPTPRICPSPGCWRPAIECPLKARSMGLRWLGSCAF
jgi:SRSO17 transposase